MRTVKFWEIWDPGVNIHKKKYVKPPPCVLFLFLPIFVLIFFFGGLKDLQGFSQRADPSKWSYDYNPL